jgi:cation diffusion facilitator family transporter
MPRDDRMSALAPEPAAAPWAHDHTFGQDVRRPGETRTLVVIAITATMMVVEVAAGVAFGSMALLADGLHMASHTAALGINAFAYAFARRHARDDAFSFGTGKVNTLGGFTGAVLLAGFAVLMVSESVQRLVSPVQIAFNHAIVVAVIGLVVNGVSMVILGRHDHDHGRDHGHGDDHDHGDADAHALRTAAGAGHGHDDPVHDYRGAGRHDHNLAAAYLHVLADALTSVLAIGALLAAKFFGFTWMDPAMGLIGAALVARWSWGLLRTTGAVLLDRNVPLEVRAAIRDSLERGGAQVVDLHVWCIGLDLYAAQIVVVAANPKPPEHYKALLPGGLRLVHVGVEVHSASAR